MGYVPPMQFSFRIMKSTRPFLWHLLGLWLVLVLASLFTRTFIPIDETRYVTVAWNMWLRGDYLVPWLNGEAYSHKPPLLFWLMNIGWAVFGVNDWWPRLVPSFFALGSVLLLVRLSLKLWPNEREMAENAALVLLGSALWIVFTTATMFDMLIAFFTLLGLLGVVAAWQGETLKGWLMLGLAIGMGLLAKGPTILLQILPVAILAPWWTNEKVNGWRWYAGLLAAIVLGAGIALLWAIPAGIRGGEVYQHAIFWGQTADRMVNAFAHKRPFWWYLPMLPVMLFPWLFWMPVWRGVSGAVQEHRDTGVRFCLAWLLPVFLAFCFISGKQVHYLLPVLPAFALLVAKGLKHSGRQRFDQWPLGIATLMVGLALVVAPSYAVRLDLAPWVTGIPLWAGIAVMLAGGALLLVRVETPLKMTYFSAMFVVIVVYVALLQSAGLAYDIRPLAARLKAYQVQGVPLAHVGEYPGQYQFAGRLIQEPEVINWTGLKAWFMAHPEGRAVVYFGNPKNVERYSPEYRQPYLNEYALIVDRQSWTKPKPRVP